MAQPFNRFTKLWNELKRRKVFRVLAMYAATAFIILEASDIMLPRLGLPDWTVTFVIILIIIGFPITAIVSWIFDITPEGLMKTVPLNEEKKTENQVKTQPKKRFFSANNIVITILFVLVVILSYPKIFGTDKSQITKAREKKKIIAVLPFMNNTGDDSYDHWEYGISELLISALSTSNELTVIDNQTITDVILNEENLHSASIGPDIAKQVARRIQVKSYIYGNYLMAGSIFRINLKLIETQTNEIVRSVYVEGRPDSIFSMVDVLSNAITDFLEISMMEEGTDIETGNYLTTSSPEAYKFFIRGMEGLWTGLGGLPGFNRAIRIDSTFTSAYFFASISLSSAGLPSMAHDAILKADEGKDKLPEKMQLWLEAFKAQIIQKNPDRAIHNFKLVSEIDPLSRLNWLWLGSIYHQIHKYEEAIVCFKQILTLNKKFGPWRNQTFYDELGTTYMLIGEYRKARRILEEGFELLPESTDICKSLAVCALLVNDTISAGQYADLYKSSFKRMSEYYPEPWRIAQVGKMYLEAGQNQKAEEIFRQALQIRLKYKPEGQRRNPGNNLYWYYQILGDLLIRNVTDLEEGMDYLHKAMAGSLEDYGEYHPFVLHSLGSGYFKQGKYVEALQVLKQAEDNMSVYDHSLNQLIQEVEQALTDQNKMN
jgi:tetratricopeptide (TPR) repeat protein/TolB-like protein